MNTFSVKPYLLNYANSIYRKSQKLNTDSALRNGFNTNIFSFSKDDIDSDFKFKNKKILNCRKGDGFWLWKPYFIYKALKSINDGNYLFYCDSGAYFIKPITPLIQISIESKQDIISFNLPYSNSQYIKGEAFVKMNCDTNDCRSASHKVAGYHLWRKSKFSVDFAHDFLEFAQDYQIISDAKSVDATQNSSDFIDHRHDQAIFSMLCWKYNLEGYRDPSQFGNDQVQFFQNSNYQQLINLTRKKNYSFYQRILKKFIKI